MGIVPAGWSRCAADKHFDANVTQWRDNGPTAPRQTNGIDLLHLFGGNGSGPMDSERDKLVLTGNVEKLRRLELEIRSKSRESWLFPPESHGPSGFRGAGPAFFIGDQP